MEYFDTTVVPITRDYGLPVLRNGAYLTAKLLGVKKITQLTGAASFTALAWIADRFAETDTPEKGGWRHWFHANRKRFAEKAKKDLVYDLSFAAIIFTMGLGIELIEKRFNNYVGAAVKGRLLDKRNYGEKGCYDICAIICPTTGSLGDILNTLKFLGGAIEEPAKCIKSCVDECEINGQGTFR